MTKQRKYRLARTAIAGWNGTPAERFWRKVRKTKTCWLWTAGHSGVQRRPEFYPRHGHPVYAHRFAWTLIRGPIPTGLFVLHKCDNVNCVNPDHLFLGTQADNVADRIAKHGTASFSRGGLTTWRRHHRLPTKNRR